MRRIAAAALLVSLTGCFGSSNEAAPDDPSPSETTQLSIEETLLEQRVLLAYGATVKQGALVVRCEADACERHRPRLPGSIRVADSQPVLTITFETRPDRVEAWLRTGSRVGRKEVLDAALLVAWRPKVPAGRHDARIAATYGSTRLEWQVPISR